MPTEPSDLDLPRASFFGEAKRRRVHRVAMAYAAGAFALVQGLDLVVEAFLWPPGVFRWGMIAVLVGFPVALVVAWFYDFDHGRLRRTGPVGESGRSAPARFVAGLAALVVVGGLLWWIRPAPAAGNVLAGADVIAVLPFRASGPGTEGLGEGMVDLLSTNLDEVGDIRTLDPAVVLREWARISGGGPLAEAEGVELGRGVGAGSVLAGQLSVAGGTARLTAELLSTADGAALARVDVEGPEADLFHLVDSLSVELLREVWRSRSPLPRLELASITTSDPGALRDYLDGEAHRRRAELDSAEAALTRAVEADSTFALAALRLSSVVGWRDSGSPKDVQSQALAERHMHRLPASMRRVMAAGLAWQERRLQEAQDSIEAILATEHDDPLAWFTLGEILYHGKAGGGGGFWDLPNDSILRAFERSLEIQPQDATALIHPLGITLEDLDREGFQARVEQFEAIAGAEPAAPIRAAGAFVFDGQGRAPEVWFDLARDQPAIMPHLARAVIAHPDRDPGAFADSVWAAGRAGGVSDGHWSILGTMLQAAGRLDDATRLAAEWLGPLERARLWSVPFFMGMSDADTPGDEMMQMLGGPDLWPLLELMRGLWRGSTEDASTMLERADEFAEMLPAGSGPVGEGYGLWARIVLGDTVQYVAEFEELLRGWPSMGSGASVMPVDFLLLPLLRMQANQRETAATALRRLQMRPWFSQAFTGPRWVAEAEALEQLGRPDEARERYQRVVDLFRDADAEAHYWRDLAEARIGGMSGG